MCHTNHPMHHAWCMHHRLAIPDLDYVNLVYHQHSKHSLSLNHAADFLEKLFFHLNEDKILFLVNSKLVNIFMIKKILKLKIGHFGLGLGWRALKVFRKGSYVGGIL